MTAGGARKNERMNGWMDGGHGGVEEAQLSASSPVLDYGGHIGGVWEAQLSASSPVLDESALRSAMKTHRVGVNFTNPT